MKKIITFTILICLIFGACAKKEPNQDTDLFKDFELDLSEMHLDFTKPQVLKYNSEFQRDSIINSLAQEFTEIAQESVTANDSALHKNCLFPIGMIWEFLAMQTVWQQK
jgi:hypothetical protein